MSCCTPRALSNRDASIAHSYFKLTLLVRITILRPPRSARVMIVGRVGADCDCPLRARTLLQNITGKHSMPRIQRNQSAVIEVSIPLSVARGGSAESDDEDDACFICAQGFCREDACLRSSTHLSCCSQNICCGCTVKLAKRCKCTDDCEAIIAFCPFCREMVSVSSLELFSGIQAVCKCCARRGPQVPSQVPSPQPAASIAPTTREETRGQAEGPLPEPRA